MLLEDILLIFKTSIMYRQEPIPTKTKGTPVWPKFIKILLSIAAVLLLLLIVGYFIAGAVIRKKVDAAIQGLPPSLQVTYTAIHPNILNESLTINGLKVIYTPWSDLKESRDSGVSGRDAKPHQHTI